MKIRYFILTAILLLSVSVSAKTELAYHISIPEPHTHYIQVRMEIKDPGGNFIDVKMPVWTPGSYLVREFAKNVEAFKAVDGSGNPVESTKINKNTWRINTKKVNKIDISYKVYAYEFSVRTSFVDADHATINGASVFMYIDGKKNLPATLNVEPYKNWRVITTSLKVAGDNKWMFHVPDYDLLVDSPIEIGNHQEHKFKVGKTEFTLAMVGEGNYDVERIITDFKKIIEESIAIYQSNPLDRYVIIAHSAAARGGGLEHLYSTLIIVNRWSFGTPAGYTSFLSLFAHEFFHVWNVKRIRPHPLGPFDYDQENYSPLLWVAEGFTSYYDEYLLRRANIYTSGEYLGKLADIITTVENTPGARVQSLAESSFDAWIKYYRQDENSDNSTISYYSKGTVLAVMLDLLIRHNSQGDLSLDDLLKSLYQEYYQKQNKTFTTADLQKAIENFTGVSMDEFFSNYVNGTKTPEYNRFFGYAGLQLKDVSVKTGQSYVGISSTLENDRLLITKVLRDSPAWKDGLNVNDEIIAVNGYRVTNNFNDLINQHNPGDKVQILVNRYGILKTLEVTLGEDKRVTYQFRKLNNPSALQKKIYEGWLGMPFNN